VPFESKVCYSYFSSCIAFSERKIKKIKPFNVLHELSFDVNKNAETKRKRVSDRTRIVRNSPKAKI